MGISSFQKNPSEVSENRIFMNNLDTASSKITVKKNTNIATKNTNKVVQGSKLTNLNCGQTKF